MNKLTKLLSVFIIAGAIGAGVAGVTGCHHHKFNNDEWKSDAEMHWHPATCGHDNEKGAPEAHADADNNGRCDVCGYEMGTPAATVTVSSVTVTAKDNATGLKVKETLQLSAAVVATPDEATNKEVTWSSSDDAKATVSATGLVTGVAEGEVTITATSKKDNTKKGTIKLTVSAAASEKEYEIIPTVVNFDKAAKDIDPNATGNFAPSADYTYENKVTFTGNSSARFEVGSNCYNTQGESGKIIIKLSGVTNSLTMGGKSASGKFKGYKLTKGTEVIKTEELPSGAEFSFTLENLPAGTYTFNSLGGAARVNKIEIKEKLEKAEATGITVEALNVDFLKGDEFSANGLAVTLNYANGRKDALLPEKYDVDKTQYNKDVEGKYSIKVTYKENTAFTATYDVYVYTIDEIELFTIGLGADNKTQVTVQQAALKDGTLSKDNLTVKGTGTVGTGDDARTHTFNLPAAALDVTLPSIVVPGEKEVQVALKTEYATGGAALSDSYKVMVKEKMTATAGKIEVTVGATDCDFKTLTQAVQFLKLCELEKSVNKIIKIAPGTYTEKVWIEMDNVTLIGTGKTDSEISTITYSLVEGDKDPIKNSVWGLSCATVHVKGKNFKAHNVTIRNDFDYINNSDKYTTGNQKAQGLALTLEGDGAVLEKCHLYGNQDTLFLKDGRAYFNQCQIDGNIDFIFGEETGLAYFEQCTIKAICKTTEGKDQNGYVTAAKHGEKKGKPDYGYIFDNCTFTADNKVKNGSMSLGRPWGKNATVAYINCKFSDAYSLLASDADGKNHRWNAMDKNLPENADFCEYGSTKLDGTKIMETAVKGGKVLTEADSLKYNKDNLFGAENGKKVDAKFSTAFDYGAALAALRAIVENRELATYTVTIKTPDSQESLGTKTYYEGSTLYVAELINYINELPSVADADKEVDKIYSAYTDATTNTPLTADYKITDSCEVIVVLKSIDHNVNTNDAYTFVTKNGASDTNFTGVVAQGATVKFGKLTIYGGTAGGNNFFANNSGDQWYKIRGDAYIEFTVSGPIRVILGAYAENTLKVTKVGGGDIPTLDNTKSMKFDITEAGTYRITNIDAAGGQQYINSISFAAIPANT